MKTIGAWVVLSCSRLSSFGFILFIFNCIYHSVPRFNFLRIRTYTTLRYICAPRISFNFSILCNCLNLATEFWTYLPGSILIFSIIHTCPLNKLMLMIQRKLKINNFLQTSFIVFWLSLECLFFRVIFLPLVSYIVFFYFLFSYR